MLGSFEMSDSDRATFLPSKLVSPASPSPSRGALLPALRAFSCLDLGAGSEEEKENDHIAVPEDYFHPWPRHAALGCAVQGVYVCVCVFVCACVCPYLGAECGLVCMSVLAWVKEQCVCICETLSNKE